MKILVVDDEELLRELIKENIELIEDSLEVDTAEDGKKAFELTKSTKYDLIFTDIKMPIMTGIEFVEELDKSDAPPPVVIVSGFVEDYVYELKYKNRLFVMKKPFDLEDIEMVVKEVQKYL